MKYNNADLVDQMFYPGWLMVSQLRTGQQVDDGKALYRRTCEWLNAWRKQLEEQGVSSASAEHMLYTLCALFDESVLNRGIQDDGYVTWLTNPLQAKYFNTLNAGEDLWERIRAVLQEPSPDIAVLTCFSRALALGFVGRYREQADERREDVIHNLSQRVPPFTLSEEAPIITRSGRLRSGRRFWWLSWGVGIVVLGGVWFLLSTSLQQMASSISGMG